MCVFLFSKSINGIGRHGTRDVSLAPPLARKVGESPADSPASLFNAVAAVVVVVADVGSGDAEY